MRLIDADVFESNMQNEWERNEISNGEWIHFREMLNAEPTIEPERKKGKWFCSDDMYETAICSCCKWDSGEAWVNGVKWFKYCPNCGADMRGEEHEND